jgi:thymidylate synthase (FAD)
MSILLFDSTVHVIASTKIDSDSVAEWAKDVEVDELLIDLDTPMGQLYDNIDMRHQIDLLTEFGGRHCYRSWDKGRGHEDYIRNILEMAHGSVLEHGSMTFAISGISRTFSHELVRHRAGVAISQESQRYVDASNIKFVVPPLMRQTLLENPKQRAEYEVMHEHILEQYRVLQEALEGQAHEYGFTGTMAKKRANEAARSVLPNNAETRMVWTANARALRHICELRGSEGADLEMRFFATKLTELCRSYMPALFEDFTVNESAIGHLPGTTLNVHSKV